MKVLSIILSGLVLQTSASFFDELRGAVSSVESSFGKLLNDVIYDVKETIDCTLMAVEQVLALSVFRDPSDYNKRCGGGTEVVQPSPPEMVVVTEPPPTPVQEVALPITKNEQIQVDSSILNVDKVLCDVLKKDDTHAQLETVKLALENETDRLTEISELLKKQLEEFSAEVKLKFKAIELQTSEPTVESIWSEIKLLHEIEHKHKNSDEARKISHVLDQILSILDADEQDRSAADDYKVQEIMRKLSGQTKGANSDLWKDLENHPKDFRDYAKKVFNENSSTLPPADVTETPEPNNKERDAEKKDKSEKTDKTTEKPKDVTTVKPKRKRRKHKITTTERPLTIEELAAQYGSLFDVMPDNDSIESAKNIIEDNKLSDEVMKSIETSKDARNLFDDPYFLGHFKK